MNDDIEKLVDMIPIKNEEKPEKIDESKEEEILDSIQEQIESPDTSIHCPESIKDKELKHIDRYPQNYVEINIVKKIRIVDTFFISSKLRSFHYKDKTYDIDEEKIYLLPTRKGFFMPTSFYYENNTSSISFKQTNEGITGKALSLLYDENLYADLFSGNENRYNLFIVIFLIVSVASYLIGLYYLIKSWGLLT